MCVETHHTHTRWTGGGWPVRGFPLAPYLVSFPCFLLVSLQHPLVSSGNPGETPWNSSFWGGSEPCLRLFWGQNRQNTGYFAGIPGKPRYTWKIPGKYLGIVPISSILPQILPQTSSQTQGNSRVSRMEHQTPSVFPGNFRQRKVLGTLCFPFCFPENLVQAKFPVVPVSQFSESPPCLAHSPIQ